MHLQIRTSPDTTVENIRTVLNALADHEVNVEGIGPDFESPHVRVVVRHADWDRALDALKAADLDPAPRAAVTFAIPNQAGQIAPLIGRLIDEGYTLESLLVLASRADDRTLVSIGVREDIPRGWSEQTAIDLGGWDESAG